jgi:predicted RND superfamily exporter protein
MEKVSRFILKIRWLIILLVLAITVFLAFQIPSLKINSDVISSLPDNDKDAVLLKKIGTKFGGNRMGMIILESGNVFTTEVIAQVKQVTDTLSEIEGISAITSLTTIMDIRADENGLEIARLINEDNPPESPEELAVLKEKVLSNANYKGTIVSEDGSSTVIVFSMDEEADMQVLANLVKSKTDGLRLPEKIYYAGSPMLITSISQLISTDLSRLLPIAFILISLVLYLGFRSFRGVVLPLLTAVLSIVWVIGIMALAGAEMSMVSNNIPIVLLAVGTAYAIHVLNRIDQVMGDLNQAIVIALTYVTIPVILAALTTIGGFLSFIFGSYLKMIMDFGLYTALGTFIALILSIFLIPALLSAFKWENRKRSLDENEAEATFFSRYFHLPLHRLLFNHTKAVLASWIAITIISIAGAFLVKRNVDIRNYFKKENPTRIAEDIMTRKFGGSKPVFVLFKGDIQSPALLNMMLKTEEYMKKSPGVIATQSIAGLIADINGALGEGRKIPDDKNKIEQIWFLLDGNESISKLVSEELDEAIIISKFLSPENKERKEFAQYMNAFIKENSTSERSIEITGMPFIETTMDRSLIKSQAGSLIIAVLFVILIVSIILRSFTAGFYAAVPIISTIMVLFGVMGYTGIPLNIATVLVASIAMGIGIDYSIHVITHFNSHINEGASISKALDETISVSGKAILINVISVSAGFLVLLFSEMVPLQYFGLLISLSMVGSGLSALTFLPVILILAHRRKASEASEALEAEKGVKGI